MANPTGHTYHYGEHNPLTEPGSSIRLRERGEAGGTPVPVTGTRNRTGRSREVASRSQDDNWCLSTTRDYPLPSFLGAVVVGFLAGRLLPF